MQQLDCASRGPLGSFLLLFSRLAWYVLARLWPPEGRQLLIRIICRRSASLGALITLGSLLLGTIVQDTVGSKVMPIPDLQESPEAGFPVTNNYAEYSTIAFDSVPEEFLASESMTSAIMSSW
jgi:hypothetical protein